MLKCCVQVPPVKNVFRNLYIDYWICFSLKAVLASQFAYDRIKPETVSKISSPPTEVVVLFLKSTIGNLKSVQKEPEGK